MSWPQTLFPNLSRLFHPWCTSHHSESENPTSIPVDIRLFDSVHNYHSHSLQRHLSPVSSYSIHALFARILRGFSLSEWWDVQKGKASDNTSCPQVSRPSLSSLRRVMLLQSDPFTFLIGFHEFGFNVSPVCTHFPAHASPKAGQGQSCYGQTETSRKKEGVTSAGNEKKSDHIANDATWSPFFSLWTTFSLFLFSTPLDSFLLERGSGACSPLPLSRSQRHHEDCPATSSLRRSKFPSLPAVTTSSILAKTSGVSNVQYIVTRVLLPMSSKVTVP